MFELKTSLGLNQSLVLTPELRQALEILAFGDLEIAELMNEELTDNIALDECQEEDQEPEIRELRIENHEGWISTDGMLFEESIAAVPTLRDNLLQQISESHFNVIEKEIAERLIEELDERGYFGGSLEDIALELSVPDGWVNCVRKRLLHFEPAGCLALDLQECLLAQLLSDELTRDKVLFAILSGGFLEEAMSKPSEVAKRLKCSKGELRNALAQLCRLNPRPGQGAHFFSGPTVQAAFAQVEIIRIGEGLQVNALRVNNHRLYVNRKATEAIARTGDKNAASFIKNKERRASWLLATLARREQTIVRVAQFLAEFQDGWFRCDAPLRPLTMKEMALNLKLHESTVSRAVANKYLRCDRGIFEIRSFFTSRIFSTGGESISSDLVRAAIRKIVASEDPRSPLSDQSICERLKADRLRVARRTVSKYREQLKISSAHHRKQP